MHIHHAKLEIDNIFQIRIISRTIFQPILGARAIA